MSNLRMKWRPGLALGPLVLLGFICAAPALSQSQVGTPEPGLKVRSEGAGNAPSETSANGNFSGLSMAITDRLSIETFFRGRSSLSSVTASESRRPGSYALVGQTLMGQYRFGEERNEFRPRLGAGLAYSFGRTDGGVGLPGALHGGIGSSTRSGDAKEVTGMGLALELGASYALSKSWYLEGSVIKSYIRGTGSALGSSSAGVAPGLKIDPLLFSFSVGFKFQ